MVFVRVRVHSLPAGCVSMKMTSQRFGSLEHLTPIQVGEAVGTKWWFPWMKCFTTNWGLAEWWQMASLLALTTTKVLWSAGVSTSQQAWIHVGISKAVTMGVPQGGQKQEVEHMHGTPLFTTKWHDTGLPSTGASFGCQAKSWMLLAWHDTFPAEVRKWCLLC